MANISINQEKCIGCKKCVSACPFGAIEMRGEGKVRKAFILDNCTLCGACVESCKFQAIELEIDRVEQSTEGYEGVWVFAESYQDTLRGVALELLSQARDLASDLDTKVTAVLLGNNIAKFSKDLIAYGADTVIVADDESLFYADDQKYAKVICSLVKKILPLSISFRGYCFWPFTGPQDCCPSGNRSYCRLYKIGDR